MTKSLTKITATALTVALVAGSALVPTAASATDHGKVVRPVPAPVNTTVRQHGRNSNLAIGAIAGLGGVLLGAALANRQDGYSESGYRGYRDDGFRSYGEQRTVRFVGGYDAGTDDCFEKPIKRFDRYTGEFVIVGTTVVCR